MNDDINQGNKTKDILKHSSIHDASKAITEVFSPYESMLKAFSSGAVLQQMASDITDLQKKLANSVAINPSSYSALDVFRQEVEALKNLNENSIKASTLGSAFDFIPTGTSDLLRKQVGMSVLTSGLASNVLGGFDQQNKIFKKIHESLIKSSSLGATAKIFADVNQVNDEFSKIKSILQSVEAPSTAALLGLEEIKEDFNGLFNATAYFGIELTAELEVGEKLTDNHPQDLVQKKALLQSLIDLINKLYSWYAELSTENKLQISLFFLSIVLNHLHPTTTILKIELDGIQLEEIIKSQKSAETPITISEVIKQKVPKENQKNYRVISGKENPLRTEPKRRSKLVTDAVGNPIVLKECMVTQELPTEVILPQPPNRSWLFVNCYIGKKVYTGWILRRYTSPIKL